jgi:hypothetical protein
MSTFKNLRKEDVLSSKRIIHEAIPLTGTIVSGTYADENIKTYGHGMFQTVYDYPYLSSSANRIVDLTAGYSANSALVATTNPDNASKLNMYNQFAKVLVGHDSTGSIMEFDEDGDIAAGGTKLKECVFLSLNRFTHKDEIKKGSFSLGVYMGGSVTGTLNCLSGAISITDTGAATNFRVNSPSGEYGFLTSSSGNAPGTVGLIYYQAGIVVLTASLFAYAGDPNYEIQAYGTYVSSSADIDAFLTGSTINNVCDGFRARFDNLTFQNSIEINSRFYNCVLGAKEFNYSSNPTYLSGSRIVVKDKSTDIPFAYVTGVGLYAPDGVLLAVAKLSEPLKKVAGQPINIKTRLDW